MESYINSPIWLTSSKTDDCFLCVGESSDSCGDPSFRLLGGFIQRLRLTSSGKEEEDKRFIWTGIFLYFLNCYTSGRRTWRNRAAAAVSSPQDVREHSEHSAENPRSKPRQNVSNETCASKDDVSQSSVA
ncbi:hypothetical protein Q8A73_015512 [Channa argus]|nr:hypothetical protein Q8A73_015512 [Channa argus]